MGADMKHSNVTETIIGAAYRVRNALGFGFLEKVYARLSTKGGKPVLVLGRLKFAKSTTQDGRAGLWLQYALS